MGSIGEQARRLMDGKTKPPGSLGMLEEWAISLAVRQGTLAPQATPARLVIFGADHGVAMAHSVSAYPSSVTAAVFESIRAGIAASCVMARSCGVSLHAIDVGIVAPEAPPAAFTARVSSGMLSGFLPGGECGTDDEASSGLFANPTPDTAERLGHTIIIDRQPVRGGTRDMLSMAAMTAAECQEAMATGRAAALSSAQDGIRVLCVGEIGIGNTASAAALLCALTGATAEEATGRGTGVSDDALAEKVSVVRRAVERAWGAHPPPEALAQHAARAADGAAGRDTAAADTAAEGQGQGFTLPRVFAEAMLEEVGGLELAAIVGAIIAAKDTKMVVVVDGFISGAAALAAVLLEPSTAGMLLLSHHSDERGAATLLAALRRAGVASAAPLHMGLRLGEGTGALLCVPMLSMACAVLKDMGSLDDTMALVGAGQDDS
eukprot:jgi/Ulvmu1/11827/UM080_0038.1